jgi:hypothetical protein
MATARQASDIGNMPLLSVSRNVSLKTACSADIETLRLRALRCGAVSRLAESELGALHGLRHSLIFALSRYDAAVFALRCAPSEDWCTLQSLKLREKPVWSGKSHISCFCEPATVAALDDHKSTLWTTRERRQ